MECPTGGEGYTCGDTSKDALPITERANSLTEDIDIATPLEITRLLRQCDSQLFSGWGKWPGLYDQETSQAMTAISEEILAVLRSPEDSAVVFSGCGTSGRLGFLVSRSFNEIARGQGLPPLYEYLIAGGDVTLFASVEGSEDDWMRGQQDLEKLAKEKKKVVFVGITCGLSAPYVAGQLDYCLSHPEVFTAVLLGFNPVHLARRQLIENWDKTFHDVACQLLGSSKGIVLNPVIGPEALTGSSRMKGGSATKLLLETVLLSAHSRVADLSFCPNFTSTLQEYEAAYRSTYLTLVEIAKAVRLAGDSLRAGGHLYYLGWDSEGAMGLLDASECVPTFSAQYDDVRGFIGGGFQVFGNRDGEVCLHGAQLEISIDDFVRNVLPNTSSRDTIIIISVNLYVDDVQHIMNLVHKRGTNIIMIDHDGLDKHPDSSNDGILKRFSEDLNNSVKISLPNVTSISPYNCKDGVHSSLKNYFHNFLKEISTKWILNAISTGAHILKGKVLKSYMIDVKVSNSKLFHRAVTIVSKFTRVKETTARACLLKAIYRMDQLSDDMKQRSVSAHVLYSNNTDRVVPLAVLLATERFKVDSALVAMENQRVAQILKKVLNTELET